MRLRGSNLQSDVLHQLILIYDKPPRCGRHWLLKRPQNSSIWNKLAYSAVNLALSISLRLTREEWELIRLCFWIKTASVDDLALRSVCFVLVWFGWSVLREQGGRGLEFLLVCFKFRLTLIPWIERLCEAGSCAPRALSQFCFIHKHHQWNWLGDLLQKCCPGLSYLYTMHVHVFVYLQNYTYIFLCLCRYIVHGCLIPCIPCAGLQHCS